MVALLGFISTAFTSMFAYLAAQMGAKFALLLVLIAAYVAAAGVFLGSISTLINSVVPATPPLVQDMLSMLPANTDTCISVVLAAEAAAYVYRQIVIIAGVKSRL